MQILENSLLGLRAARHRLISSEFAASVTLFPMVHVGDSLFYEIVYEDASNHDVVLVEGLNSPISRRITRSYRWIEKSDLGLIVQPSYKTMLNNTAIVHADLSAEEFAEEWKKVSFGIRVLMYAGSIYLGIKNRWFSSRHVLAEGHSLNDLASRDAILSWNPDFAAVGNAILTARDKRLIECLNAQLEKYRTKECKIAVVYGASHMPAVLRALRKDGRYRAVESKWLTVFKP